MGDEREHTHSAQHADAEPNAEIRSNTGSATNAADTQDPLVIAALELFRTRPEERWTVESLAKELATSRAVLNRRFNEALGRPPLSVLREFRMEKAARRLMETDDGLAAIADEVGYDSEFALSRAFYRHFGVRPGAWRHSAQRSASNVTRCAA